MSHPHDDEPPALYAVPPPDDELHGRVPPNDQDAEQAVLGGILLSATALADVRTQLQPTDFYRPAHELIYTAALHLTDDGQPVDMVTVATHLKTNGDLNRAGGAPYLHTLTQAVPTAANAAYYAQAVQRTARLRALVEAGTKISQLGYADTPDVDDVVTRAADVLTRATTSRDTGTTSTWQPVALEQFLYGNELDTVPPAHLPRSDGACLLYAGAVHSIAGEPESGKTWVALIAAADEIAQAHNVLYVDFEDRPARVINRLLTLGAHPSQIEQHFRYIRPETALNPSTAPHLAAAAEDTTVAVIDGITEAMTLHGLSLLDNEDVARWLALLPRRLADQGPAVLQIDHVIKNTETRGRYAIGGQHKLAGIDGCAYKITVTEPFGRGKRGHARITLDKDREGHVRAITLGHTVATLTLDSRDDATHTSDHLRAYLDPPTADTGPDGTFRPTGLMEKVSRFLEVNPSSAKRAIEDVVRGKREHVRTALQSLINEGYVRVEPGPHSAALHYSERPYREDDDQ